MTETLGDLGEFALVERFTRDLMVGAHTSVGPGDDAAVLSVDGALVASTDVLNEGVHFRTDWVSGEDVGHRGVGAALADIEAMGAVPTAVMIAFSAPKTLPLSWVDQFVQGVAAECDTAHVGVVGGDISRAEMISIAVTALGQTAGRPVVKRSGAVPGDLVAMKGRLGWAAAGLAVLSRGFRSPRVLVHAYQRPQIPYGGGAQAARHGATSMIDISDGLVADLAHIATASAVRIDLDSAAIPIPEPLMAVSQATGKDPMTFILTGGEDHALVASFPAAKVPSGWPVIGEVRELDGWDPGVLVDGREWVGHSGWTHF